MKRDWSKLLGELPPGLTFSQVAKRLKAPYGSTRIAIHCYRYPASDGRAHGQRLRRILDPEKVDWSKSDIEIARELLISKQRVNLVRHQFRNGKNKSPLTKKGK